MGDVMLLLSPCLLQATLFVFLVLLKSNSDTAHRKISHQIYELRRTKKFVDAFSEQIEGRGSFVLWS